MTQCIACHQEINDPQSPEVLEMRDGPGARGNHSLNAALGYTPPITMMLHSSYIHFRCVSPHSDHLHPDQRKKWLEWRIRVLERQQEETKQSIQDMAMAIREIDPDTYYAFVEEPFLHRENQDPKA